MKGIFFNIRTLYSHRLFENSCEGVSRIIYMVVEFKKKKNVRHVIEISSLPLYSGRYLPSNQRPLKGL